MQSSHTTGKCLQGCIINKTCRLFQEWLVDQYITMEMGRLKFVEMNQEEYTWQMDVLDPEKMIYRPADPEDETDKQMLLCMRTSFPCSKDVSLETDIWHGVGQS